MQYLNKLTSLLNTTKEEIATEMHSKAMFCDVVSLRIKRTARLDNELLLNQARIRSKARARSRQCILFFFSYLITHRYLEWCADKLNYVRLSTIELVGQNEKYLQFTFTKLYLSARVIWRRNNCLKFLNRSRK
ncbi:hypothetical protein ALC57_11528 [Trachymyrmex cornetzi]|uniref:Uncharacterized protein n=1 Tax=Trachymyrmex cornetzi TaxID=471704 RepID=A0A151J2C7_9HYME|nr:hypothetical protein ALC57_11528 [Trachymyrmex cornetzi]